ncbi:MAG: substrate-binding periplasmic protein [Rhodospirillaceae bacterium]
MTSLQWLKKSGLAALAVVAFALPVRAETSLTLYTEDYWPFNFQEGDKITGSAVEVVELLMEKAAVPYTLELVPWRRAYNAAQNELNACVFSTNVTEERLPLFSWVEPVIYDEWVLFAMADRNIAVDSIDAVKAAGFTVGGYKGDALSAALQAEGVTVDDAPTDDANPKKLAAGRIDLWATSRPQGPNLSKQQGVEGVVAVHTFHRNPMGLACHKDTDPAVIEKLSTTLAAMRDDGTVAEIESKYD